MTEEEGLEFVVRLLNTYLERQAIIAPGAGPRSC